MRLRREWSAADRRATGPAAGPTTRTVRTAVVVAGLASLLSSSCTDDHRPVTALFAATAPYRLTLGRPARLATYATYLEPAEHARLSTRQLRDLARAAATLSAVETADSLDASHGRALVALWSGRPDRAVDWLESVASMPTARSHEIWNDLAVAHLERGVRQDRTLDVVRAVAAAERALEVRPDWPPAAYNRAVALTRLGLRHEARSAWEAYLALAESRSGSRAWRDEARHHLSGIAVPDRQSLWAAAVRSIDRPAPDPSLARELGREFPFQARRWAERELFAAWAEAVTTGDSAAAEAISGALLALGEALGERGERMVADAAVVLRRAGTDPISAAAVATAHRLLGRGLAAYFDEEFERARGDLGEARRGLAAAGSPLAHLASFVVARCRYETDADGAAEMLLALEAEVDAGRYPSLAGEIDWRLGIIDEIQGRREAALARYRAGTERMQRGSGDDGAAFGHVMLAGTLDRIGETERAWRHWTEALVAVSAVGIPAGIRPLLVEISERFLDSDQPALAAPFVTELMAVAGRENDAIAWSEAHRQRARLLRELGRSESSLRALEAARRATLEIPEGGLRTSRLASLELDEGLLLARLEPAAALPRLEAGFEKQERAGYLHHRLRYLDATADAHLALGRDSEGRRALLAAVDHYEALRSELTEATMRAVTLSAAQDLFDRLIEHEIAAGAAPRRTLALAEQSRARFLLDLAPHPDTPGPRTASRLQALLPPRTAVVELAVLPSGVAAWVLTADSLDFEWLAVPPTELERLARSFRSALELDSGLDRIHALGERLFERLVSPLELDLESLDRLTFVPDRFLLDLPYSALRRPGSGSYLIELVAVSIAPSLALLELALERRATPRRAPTGRLLAVAVPEVARSTGLPPLPWAEQEARRVAEAYADATLLVSRQATRERFLAALPEHAIVHFAGHALANPDALLRSKLLLASTGDGPAEILAHDLLGLDLSRVELVVLSACSTLDGYRVDRESLLSLGGVFFAKGVPSVVSTLWSVDDQATAVLMESFHRHYAESGQAAPALRESIAAQRGSPAQWAGFVVIGV